MFEGLVVTRKEMEVKRGLLTFPLAIIIQFSVITAAVLWGVFSVVNIEAPSSIPIFSAPPTVAPPPPAGNSDMAKPKQLNKTPGVAKIDKNEPAAPVKETGKTENPPIDDSNVNRIPGVPGGIPGDWIDDEFKKPIIEPPSDIRPILKVGEVVAPRLVFSPPPEYPPMALRLGIRGKVEVEMVVNESGAVESARIVSSSNRMFEEPVLKTVKTWRFTPPVDRSGQKVAVYYTRIIAFDF